MPRYDFRCQACRITAELLLSIADRDSPQACPECQTFMNRLIGLPHPAIVPATGRDKVLADLNSKDDGRGNYPHHKAAMWKGLHQRGPVVGRGFG